MTGNEISKITIYKLQIDSLDSISIPKFECVRSAIRTPKKSTAKKQPRKASKTVYKLYFLKQSKKNATWYKVFKDLDLDLDTTGIPKTLVAGFILIINLNDKSFYGITGGVGHSHLKKACDIEPRFGIEIAESILSLPEIRGLVQKDTSGEVNYLNRAFRGIYNPHGDIDNLKRVLTNVRGSLKKQSKFYKTIGQSIQASNALSVNGQKDFDGIIKFVKDVDKIYQKGDKSITIPKLDHIDKKFEAALLEDLEKELVATLCRYKKGATYSLFLDNEEIGYLPDRITKYNLTFNRKKHELTTYEDVFEKVKSLLKAEPNKDRVKNLNRMTLEVTFDDETAEKKPLKYFICGDIEHDKEVYFLNNKLWFRTSEDYVSKLDHEIDNIEYIKPEVLSIIEWNPKKYKGKRAENDFNKANKSFKLLDCHLVKIDSQKGNIEFCDLLKEEEDKIYLVHVKRESGAALRALFAQVFVSAKLYAEDDTFREKVCTGDLTGDETVIKKLKPVLSKLKDKMKRDFKVIIAIHDNQPSHKVSKSANTTSEHLNGTLTTFAKVDVLDRVKSIRSMGYEVAITRIKPFPEVD